jgi:hypothetical protein
MNFSGRVEAQCRSKEFSHFFLSLSHTHLITNAWRSHLEALMENFPGRMLCVGLSAMSIFKLICVNGIHHQHQTNCVEIVVGACLLRLLPTVNRIFQFHEAFPAAERTSCACSRKLVGAAVTKTAY